VRVGKQQQFFADACVDEADAARESVILRGYTAHDPARCEVAVIRLKEVFELAVVKAAQMPTVHGGLLVCPHPDAMRRVLLAIFGRHTIGLRGPVLFA